MGNTEKRKEQTNSRYEETEMREEHTKRKEDTQKRGDDTLRDRKEIEKGEEGEWERTVNVSFSESFMICLYSCHALTRTHFISNKTFGRFDENKRTLFIL